MADTTNIAWADATFNPWIGCTKVSLACDHCYAEAWDKRYGGALHWGPGVSRRRAAEPGRRKPHKWNREAEASGKPFRVFCGSLCDVFDNEVPPEWRADLFDLVRETPALTWMLLTKRIGNVAKMLPDDWGDGWPHVWLGATIPNQEEADRDIPKLIALPAAKRFISYEPALGPLFVPQYGVHWLICGGESGPGARPMKLDWARSVRDQCASAGVAFFFKQRGGARPGGDARLDGLEHKNFPGEVT